MGFGTKFMIMGLVFLFAAGSCSYVVHTLKSVGALSSDNKMLRQVNENNGKKLAVKQASIDSTLSASQELRTASEEREREVRRLQVQLEYSRGSVEDETLVCPAGCLLPPDLTTTQ